MKEIKIRKDEIFYAASTFRQLGSKPKDIEKTFSSYEDANNYLEKTCISEDGKSIFIKRNNIWFDIVKKDNKYYILQTWM